ncbi:tetratricopeptide repeat protein [Phormidesmis priestleyi]|uniref:tetratricopeptide repeat protein n=1 Tax=Phormidesmis priestleyi TaxID=268141 RepID=UPI00083AD536|nr:tetratricopeptide repeat protein [Phormidesmis priestleyi]
MTVSSFDWDDELPPETGEEVYRALRRALQRKQGFGLFFVQCSKSQGAEIVASLHHDLPKQQIQELHLVGEVTTLYDQIDTLWQQQPFDVLVLDGLEASLYAYEDVKRLSGWGSGEIYNYSWKGVPKILNHLNQQREHLRNDFPARFVFLVPPFVVDYFIQRAADFLDWRSGLFRFPPDSKEVAAEADRFLSDGGYNQYVKLMPQERVEKILTLKAMLQEMGVGSERRQCDLLLKLGLLFVAEQDYENAITSWEKLLAIKPDYHEAWCDRGVALSTLGRKEEAVQSYDRAVAIKPDDHKAWHMRGVALSALGRKEEAVQSYDRAVAIKPDDHEAWYIRGLVLSVLGRQEEAVQSYDRAVAIKPDYHAAWYNRGNALSALGRNEEAIQSYDKAVDIKPDKHEAWYNRGVALDDLGRKEEAIQSYDKAVDIKPDKHEAWYSRGVALDDLGRKEEAIQSYDKAVDIKPDKHEAWYNRGNALSDLGRKEEAIQSYDKALQIQPDYASAYYNKACCYALQGTIDLAIATLRQAITLDSDYQDMAKTDPDFDRIRNDDRFRALIGE